MARLDVEQLVGRVAGEVVTPGWLRTASGALTVGDWGAAWRKSA